LPVSASKLSPSGIGGRNFGIFGRETQTGYNIEFFRLRSAEVRSRFLQ